MKTRREANGFGLVAATVLTLVLGFTLPAQSQTNLPPPLSPPDHTFLIAFGNTNSFRGINVPSPDIQGHYWNSVADVAFNSPLTNAAGQVTTAGLVFDFPGGNDFFNGPAGTNQNPAACVIDTNALGYLGINAGVFHYYVSSDLEIINLDPTKKYTLVFFGSHKFSADAATVYTLYTDNTFSTPTTSIALNVDDPLATSNHNVNTVATIANVSPQPDGVFYLGFLGSSGNLGYLNCMQIVDLSTNTPPPPPPPPVNQTVLIKMGDNQTFRGTNAPSPDIHGHYWNSVDNGQFFAVLTNAAGGPSPLAFGFDASSTNDPNFGTDFYNGPAESAAGSPVQNPNACVINTNALGYLGISGGVYNYYVNARFQIQGMDPTKSYSLTFFGSHQFNDDPITVYNIYSDGTYSTILTSVYLYVGAPNYSYWNQSALAVISPISPQTNGIIYVGFAASDGSGGYLNCLQVVDLSVPSTDPFTIWQSHYFGGPGDSAAGGADPDGDGFNNTNEFLAGFSPLNSSAYPHILSIVKSNSTNLVINYLGASGDSTWLPGVASRTNVLEFTTGTVNGSYSSNNFVSTGQTNILSGGTGLGTVASFIQTNGVTGATLYYRVRVLVP